MHIIEKSRNAENDKLEYGGVNETMLKVYLKLDEKTDKSTEEALEEMITYRDLNELLKEIQKGKKIIAIKRA